MRRRRIVRKYLKTWFLLDLVASFPYAYIFLYHSNKTLEEEMDLSEVKKMELTPTSQLLRLLKIIRLLRVIRLMRILKL